MNERTYLVRIVLPNKPGSLGALATALGQFGIDIETLDVVEHRPDGTVVDDLVLLLPASLLAETVFTACQSVPAVRVESLRPHPRAAETVRDLELLDAIAAQPQRALQLLADLAPEAFRCAWAAVVTVAAENGEGVVAASMAAPAPAACPVPAETPKSARRVQLEEAWVPSEWRERDVDAAVAPVGESNCVLLLARPAGPAFLDGELIRLGHLANLAALASRGVDEPAAN